jgi:hypothetical protein
LKGPGPFQLPETQRATAASERPNAVTLVLYASDEPTSFDDSGEHQKAISTHMTPGVARDLAIRLWLAADRSEWKAK